MAKKTAKRRRGIEQPEPAEVLVQEERYPDESIDKVPSSPTAPEKPARRGRPPIYETEDEFTAMVWDYIDHCKETGEMPNKAGMRFFLRISKDTWNVYRDKFPDAHKEAEDYLEAQWVERLAGTTPTGAIFYLKNAFKDDYKDRHENDNTHRFDKLELDDIRSLIAVLPPGEQEQFYELIAKLAATAGARGRKEGQGDPLDRSGDDKK